MKFDNMKQLDIPFFSQLDAHLDEVGNRTVCTIACLKMILDFKNKSMSFEEIYDEALYIKGEGATIWTHETLVRVLRNHGVLAYRQEFIAHKLDIKNKTQAKSEYEDLFKDLGIEKIKKSIDNSCPVCVSVKENFSQNKEDHMVLIGGYTEDSFIIFDPILLSNENPLEISFEKFKTYWKGLSIFVE